MSSSLANTQTGVPSCDCGGDGSEVLLDTALQCIDEHRTFFYSQANCVKLKYFSNF